MLRTRREYHRAYYHRTRRYVKIKDVIRVRHLKSRYGISERTYNRLLKQQGGVCAICKNPPTKRRRLAVDHDHDTGEVRGLLCLQCNNFIGLAKDSVLILASAIEYLQETINAQD